MWSYLLSYVYYFKNSGVSERLLEKKSEKKMVMIEEDDFFKLGGMVTVNDLKSVTLQPVKPLKPMNYFPKVDLRNLNKDQLYSILNVKLRPTPQNNIIKRYEVRHPCLRELLKSRAIIN